MSNSQNVSYYETSFILLKRSGYFSYHNNILQLRKELKDDSILKKYLEGILQYESEKYPLASCWEEEALQFIVTRDLDRHLSADTSWLKSSIYNISKEALQIEKSCFEGSLKHLNLTEELDSTLLYVEGYQKDMVLIHEYNRKTAFSKNTERIKFMFRFKESFVTALESIDWRLHSVFIAENCPFLVFEEKEYLYNESIYDYYIDKNSAIGFLNLLREKENALKTEWDEEYKLLSTLLELVVEEDILIKVSY